MAIIEREIVFCHYYYYDYDENDLQSFTQTS